MVIFFSIMWLDTHAQTRENLFFNEVNYNIRTVFYMQYTGPIT